MGNIVDTLIKNTEIPRVVVDDLNRLTLSGQEKLYEFGNNVVNKADKIASNMQKIGSKQATEVISTAQYAVFMIGLPVLVFILNTSSDNIANTVVKPAEAVIEVAKKIP